MAEHCNWKQQDEDESDFWKSDCGHSFVFIDGSPIDNNMHYCCRCGKPLSETAMIWDDESGGFVPGETRYHDEIAPDGR
jgi:hypothetical protein